MIKVFDNLFSTFLRRWMTPFILTVVWLVAINLIWLIPTIRDIRSSASVLALEIANGVKRDINFYVNDAIDELNSSAQQMGIEPSRANIILRRLIRENDLFVNAALVDRRGREVDRVDRLKLITSEDLIDHSKDPYFHFALEGATGFSEIFLSSSFEPRINIAVPVYSLGEITGILVSEINLRNLVEAVRAFNSEDGHIYVVDNKGFQFLHPDIAEVLKRVNFYSRSIVEKVIIDGVVADGLSSEDSYINSVGQKVFAVGVPVPETGWGVFVEQPRSRALATEKQVVSFAFITVILGIVIFLIIVRGNTKVSQLNERLRALLRESEETAKILVRRDLELTKVNERLLELDVVKSQFVSIAAHQLRTPLTGIKWSLYSLLEGDVGDLNEGQKEIADDAAKATERLVELINGLLDVARLEEGRSEFKFKKEDIVSLIESAIEEHKTVIKEKDISISVVRPKTRLPLINIDIERIKIVFDNILDNAIKYTNKGGKINIKISLYRNRVVVSVQDTGIGIPKEQQPRVFTKFFRSRNAQLMQTGGTGLGLAICKEIIEKHEGTIGFVSEENKGSTFYFSLPAGEQGG